MFDAVDEAFLVRVLHGGADVGEQFEPGFGVELFFSAIPGDRDALDQLHDEVGAALVGGAGVVNFGDVGVVHQRERLALGLEAGDDFLRIHPRLDDLERDAAFHRLALLGQIDDAEPAFADLL